MKSLRKSNPSQPLKPATMVGADTKRRRNSAEDGKTYRRIKGKAMNDELKKCDNPGCNRLTKQGIEFCCYFCRLAREDGYEIHESGVLGHSDGCNARHIERSNAQSA